MEETESYRKNSQPVSGIEIKASRGKLRFGSILTPAEKTWLVADVREAVFGPQPMVSQPGPREHRSSHFSVEIPGSISGRWRS